MEESLLLSGHLASHHLGKMAASSVGEKCEYFQNQYILHERVTGDK